jgi:predicted lipid-binding transport protein (Tim44 family)
MRMEELVQRVAAAAGITPEKAYAAIGKIIAFLKKEAPSADMEALLAELPGASEAAESAAATPGSGGLLAGLLGAMGGGGLAGLAGQLTGLGLGMGEIQAIGKEIFAVAREKLGEERVGQIIAAIPGLGQLI